MIKLLKLGYGHATRTSLVVSELVKRGHTIYLMTNAPFFLFSDTLDKINTRKCTLLDPPLSHNNACT